MGKKHKHKADLKDKENIGVGQNSIRRNKY